MNSTTKFKLSENQVSSNLSGETVILNHKDGLYYGLDEVGTFIWEKIQEKTSSKEELLSQILDNYEIDAISAEKDLDEILKQLLDEKLVEEV